MSPYIESLQRNDVREMYEKQGINYLGIFGSAARGEERKDSDVDLLVDFNRTKTFFDLADIQLYLEEVLGKRVDLVSRKGLKKQLRPYVEKDLITVYEKN